MKRNKGSTSITTPIIIGISIILISTLIVTSVKILMPYIWYEKLSSTCIKYIFVIEEYGYLTQNEAKLLKNELKQQGFDEEKISLKYTSRKVNYGEEIYLKINYLYSLELPITGEKEIPMQIEKYSICKR